ncbi:MAG: DinB family protein [Phaeodactylibacter sp.]|nr:DinB family protein [Phaeodactylibacter sp.]MCB9275615.1 DinB family protein [Lewinellaceae bacterium]
MAITDIKADIMESLSAYEQALASLTPEALVQQPAPDSWSMGQLYIHLLDDTMNFHLRLMEACLSPEAPREGEKSKAGEAVYQANAFADIRVKGRRTAENVPQPSGKAELEEKAALLRAAIGQAAGRLDLNPPSGKIEHPALGYLNATEWYQLIAIHFRHHLRQKARIEAFLNG